MEKRWGHGGWWKRGGDIEFECKQFEGEGNFNVQLQMGGTKFECTEMKRTTPTYMTAWFQITRIQRLKNWGCIGGSTIRGHILLVCRRGAMGSVFFPR